VDLLGDLAIVLTLVLLEAVLSFDNAAILTVLSRRLHDLDERRRALNIGLLIAYGLRVAAILAAVVLVQQPLFLVLGGLYLVVLGIKHFVALARKGDEHLAAEHKPILARIGLGAFAAVVLEIGVIDLVFALDQVVAAVGFVRGHEHATILIIIAASLGLLSLRLLAPFIGRLMDWLPLLEHMAFVAVAFVGGLMLLEHTSLAGGLQLVASPEAPGAPAVLFHMEKTVKIGVTLALFAVPVFIKLAFKVPRSHPGVHAAVETDFAAKAPHRGEEVAQGDPKHPGETLKPR
jgi:YkoY family integral membrane protein